MKIPYSWLKELLPQIPPVSELEPIFARLGLPLEGIATLPSPPSGVLYGEVLHCEAIPETHLFKLTVNVGEQQTIVTGAPNSRAGVGVAVVSPGTQLGNITLGIRTMQGVESWGMCASPKELGIGDYAGGLLLLPLGTAPVGTELRTLLPEDYILDIEITPNRADALSVLGIARDLSAFLNIPLHQPSKGLAGKEGAGKIEVILNEHICNHFVCRTASGIDNGPAPLKIQKRLLACGSRPINFIVDVSNYVMWELGQPTAVYDARDLPSKRIVVDSAREGEDFFALNDTDYELTEKDLLIRSGEGLAVGLAGIIGANYGSVRDDTTSVVLEAAHFDPIPLRLTARRLGLSTDAVYHYERGVDPNLPVWAANRITQLLADSGADVDEGTTRVGDFPFSLPDITLDPDYANRLLGMDIPQEDIKNYLEALGCTVAYTNNPNWTLYYPMTFKDPEHPELKAALTQYNQYMQEQMEILEGISELTLEKKLKLQELQNKLTETHTVLMFFADPKEKEAYEQKLREMTTWLRVTPPTWRMDLKQQEDLIEEIVRMYGYDKLPETIPHLQIHPDNYTASQHSDKRNTVRHALAGIGFQEVVTYSFSNATEAEQMRTPPLVRHLKNPLTADRTAMRSALYPSLLKVAQQNTAEPRLMLFEVGRIFPEQGESERLALLMRGNFAPPSWQKAVASDFYTFKSVVEVFALNMGADFKVNTLNAETAPPYLHPGIAGAVLWNGQNIGYIGQLHPAIAQSLGLKGETYLLDVAMPLPEQEWTFADINRNPAALRDLAIITPNERSYGEVESLIYAHGGEYVEQVQVFDVYSGEPVPSGFRSIAVRISYRANRTLTEEEVNRDFQHLIAALKSEKLSIREQ